MAEVKFGVVMPWAGPDLSAVEEVEALGYDSVWTSEHIFFYGPTMDAFTVLAAYAARTRRLLLGTAVTLLPLRPAAVVAKEATSLDILSGGRLILGVGVGGEYPKEFEACGVPVQERGARTNEAIRLLRRLWREDVVSHQGRFWRLNGVSLQPKPVQAGGPPIWVAGRSEAAMRRAGRLGDGYVPYLFSPERFRDGWAKVQEYARAAGRDPAAITPALYQFISLADSYEEAKAAAVADLSRRYNQPFENLVDRYVVMGTARDCVRRLEQYVEAGVRHFLLVFIGPGGTREQVRACARDVLPALR